MYPVVKRIADVVVSMIALVILSPLLAAIAAAVAITSPGGAIFKQQRVGRNGAHFELLKFRTMSEDAPHDIPTHLLTEARSHVTPVGRFLRRTSFDELPQLWCVIRGDMSLVGPRPALWNQFDLIESRERYHANDVRPGITGWAQVNGRDELPVAEKATMDGYYVANVGPMLDLKCIVLTIAAVVTARGVVEGPSSQGD